MELSIVIFTLIEFGVGLLLFFYIRAGRSRKKPLEGANSTSYQQALKAQRQMERRRDRVWWNIEDLYSEFVEKSAIKKPLRALPPPQLTPSENARVATKPTGEVCSLKDVQNAYEMFRRISEGGTHQSCIMKGNNH
jgi:hypothetical protein